MSVASAASIYSFALSGPLFHEPLEPYASAQFELENHLFLDVVVPGM